jgi:hypothetical protein
MIATRFRSVYWVGGVAVAALSCYLVSQRVAAERADLTRVETEIAMNERQIRALETEIGTRAGMNQIERWNVEVLSLSAPKAGQFMANEVQLASLIRPSVPAMDAPAAVRLASAPSPAASAPQITRVSYQASMPAVDQDEAEPARVVRASYAAPAPVRHVERAVAPQKSAPKAEAAHPEKRERTATADTKAKASAKPERSAKRDTKAAPERTAKRDAKAPAERSAKRDVKATPERSAKRDVKSDTKADTKRTAERTAKRDAKVAAERTAKRVAERKAEDNAARVRPAIYVKPVSRHQSVALLDDKLMGDLGRLAHSERSGGKRNR